MFVQYARTSTQVVVALCPTGGDGANSVRLCSTLSLHLLFDSGWGWTLL